MDAEVVLLRVQVIDLKSFVLDLQVPTYLPARDLTQRIARDAGLEAYWPDGKRRLYWLRARGRLLGDDEKLKELGVINHELVYLLPEPPHGSGVVEQPPEYPETHPYFGAGWGMLFGSLAMVFVWAVAWGISLVHARAIPTIIIPGLTLGFFCVSLSRHAWGGRANRIRVAITATVLLFITTGLTFVTPLFFQKVSITQTVYDAVAGVIFGVFGVVTGWLAWWGAVEPLPPMAIQKIEDAPQQTLAVPCGICGQLVEPDVRSECQYKCGRVFHQGCYKAKIAVYRGDRSKCAVCGVQVA
jgi:uncharacterized ubiquitin-like protein YukD